MPEIRLSCLVQARFAGKAQKDLAEMETRFSHVRGRVQLVGGDIVTPDLGMGGHDKLKLRADLAGAFHLAAVYDLAVERQVAQRINVEGTENVLRFLEDSPRGSHLHYVSTAYVSGNATGVFRETDLDAGQGFRNHYEETKFLAEVAVARSGQPATIYRPAIVVGDSRSGETGKFDGPYFAVRAMERLPSPGLFLRVGAGRSPLNVVPVDFVVEALAQLAANPLAHGRTFHLTDPEPLAVRELSGLLASALGRRFLFVPVPLGLGKRLIGAAWIQAYLGMPVQALDYFDHACAYDATQATRLLEPLGVRCPRFSDYVGRLLAFYKANSDSVRRSAMI